jgi:transcriptional regulator GlxA family with amidase domain
MFGSLKEEFKILTIAQEPGAVASVQGPATVAEYSFVTAPPLDLVLIPGGIGTLGELENKTFLDFLCERAATAEMVMSVCSGSALLAKAGLLDGKRATSNKMFFDLARNQSAAVDWVEQARWVVDGKFATSSGVSAGTDMALAAIEQLVSSEAAERIAIFAEYQWHRDSSKDPFAAYLNQGSL